MLDLEQGLRTVKRILREAGLAESDAVDYARIPDGLALDRSDRDRARRARPLGAEDLRRRRPRPATLACTSSRTARASGRSARRGGCCSTARRASVRDPKDTAPPRDLEAEIEAFLLEHPGSSTNAVTKRVGAGKDTVSSALHGSDRFDFTPGSNNAKHWVVCGAQTTQTTRRLPEATRVVWPL